MKKAEAFRAKNISSRSQLFLTAKVKKALTKLGQAFVKASILNHFDLEHHIQIKTDVSGYNIGGIFRQQTLNDLS